MRFFDRFNNPILFWRKQDPTSAAYKSLVRRYVKRIEVGRYAVGITLATGLGMNDELDKTFVITRKEIYMMKKAVS